MSQEGMLWAVKDAPVASGVERLILIVMGESADADGCNAALSQQEIAVGALIADARTVRDHLRRLEERGLIARGDQTVVDYLPPGKRPIVWDLMIPYSWFGNIDRITAYRARRGRGPLTPQMRPDIDLPPPRKARADKGVSRNPGLSVRGETGLSVRGDELAESDIQGGLTVRGDSQSGVQNRTNLGEDSGWPDSESDNPYVLTQGSKNPLLVPTVTAEINSGSGGGGFPTSEEPKEPEVTLEVAAAWFARQLRPDARYAALAVEHPKAWNADVVEYTLKAALKTGRCDIRQAAGLLRRLADGEFGKTASPRRLLYEAGEWWATVKPAAPPRQVDAPRCTKPGHVAQPADRCIACASDARGRPDDLEPDLCGDPQLAAARAAEFLARVRRNRVAA